MINYLKNSNLFIKISHWEYWPIWVVYLPILPIFFYYAFKSKRFFFFSNVNPSFKTGAFLGASKFQILNQVPDALKPITILSTNSSKRYEAALENLSKSKIEFPLIAKPDVGERGLLVELLKNKNELYNYLNANKHIDIILQEYVDLPNECGIFYIRNPLDKKGKVVSVGLKAFMIIKGDGKSTLRELMTANPRFKLQVMRFEKDKNEILDKILQEGEELNMEPIGNHSRGTTFLDGNHLICSELNTLFDHINGNMKDVYYGRFDVKYRNWESLLKGKDLKIIEMNGVASEPIHVYDETVPIKDKYSSFYKLWKTIFEISKIQKNRGIYPIKTTAAIKAIREYKNYIRSINLNWRNEVGNTSISA